MFSHRLNNRGIWLLVLLAVFGLGTHFTFQEQRIGPLPACKSPAITNNLVNCDGVGESATALFLLFGTKININKASAIELKQIPKVRLKIAQAIVDKRKTLGKFSSYDEVDAIKGIGPKTLEIIKAHTTL